MKAIILLFILAMGMSKLDFGHLEPQGDLRLGLFNVIYPTEIWKRENLKMDGIDYVNEPDGYLKFTCPPGEYIFQMYNQYDNEDKDRRFKFACRKGPITNKCSWSTWSLNTYGGRVDFQCSDFNVNVKNGVISGWESRHDNSKEDRTWKVYCCEAKNHVTKSLRNFTMHWFDMCMVPTGGGGSPQIPTNYYPQQPSVWDALSDTVDTLFNGESAEEKSCEESEHRIKPAILKLPEGLVLIGGHSEFFDKDRKWTMEVAKVDGYNPTTWKPSTWSPGHFKECECSSYLHKGKYGGCLTKSKSSNCGVYCYVSKGSCKDERPSKVTSKYNWSCQACKETCMTTSGKKPGVPCKFPFIYKGIRYNGCSGKDAQGSKPWCSTRTGTKEGSLVHVPGNWGHCDPKCPRYFTAMNEIISSIFG